MIFMITSKVKKWLNNNNITELTNVQKKSIPLIKHGRNALITAPTGYGKTLAVIIPIFEKLVKEGAQGLNVLYIAPTKSLNRDIFKRVFEFAEHLGLTISVRHGDTTSYKRSKQVKNPPNILITTPESLQSMLISDKMRSNLKELKHVVVDEIHELVSSKRGSQLSLGLERVNRISSFSRIGISATISNLEEVAEFLTGDRGCEIVQISEPKESHVEVFKPFVNEKGESLSKELNITRELASVMFRIKQDLEEHERVIIFTNTRQQAEVLSFSMKNAFPDLKIGLHHSSLSKNQRVKMENGLKDESLKALICTSSMELGIDVGSVDLVIQFMSPRQVNKLVQRVGRSGHAYYKKSYGKIYTINDDDFLESTAIVELMKQGYLEKPIIPFNALDVLAHQIIGFLKDDNIAKKELLKYVNKSYCFNIEENEFNDFLQFLEYLDYLSVSGERVRLRNKSLFYYFENVSTIPDVITYSILNVESNSRIGTLHEAFVMNNCNAGAVIIIRGEPWEVLEVKEGVVNVARAKSFNAAIPSWSGELIPVSKKVANRVGSLRHEYYDNGDVIDDKSFYVEKFENNIIIHSCHGSKVNNTLGSVFSSLLSSRLGDSVGLRTDPYRVIITSPVSVSLKYFKETIKDFKPCMIMSIVRLSAKNSTLFHNRFFNVGQRFGIISKDAEFIGSKISKIIGLYENSPIYEETLQELIREKMSVETAENLLKDLEIIYSNSNNVSKIGFKGVNFGGFKGVFRTADSYKEVYNIVKNRLLNKRFRFKCLNCGLNLGVFKVSTLPFKKCPECSAKLISFKPSGKKVKNEYLEETANLFLTYGSKACFVLAAYGVGLRSGKRILRNSVSEEHMVKKIIEQEKRFVRTRRFWD